MTSGPGITDKTDSPDDAIEEISGLLEMEESKASPPISGGSGLGVSEAVGEVLDVSMETPSPARLDSYLPPPPVSDEPVKPRAEAETGSGSNMAYEDLLERLVLPTPAASGEEAAAHQLTPRPSQAYPSAPAGNLFPSDLTPGPSSDERTVVTVNPLLAEEQEAARGTGNYSLPPAQAAQPFMASPPVVAPQALPVTPKFAILPGRVVQTSAPIFGSIVLGGIILGVLLGRVSAPSKEIEKTPVVQSQPVEAQPVVPAAVAPAPAAQPVAADPETTPAPKEVPTPAAQPAAAAEPAAPAPAASAEAEPAEQAKPEAAKRKAHGSRPHAKATAKPVAPQPVAAAKPVPTAKPAAAAKPAPAAKGGKKPGKGWVDPFAN